ncbi:MAG: diphthine--ammonia ligase [Candidatus Aenigmarchaeota archaeon]|nr:diphthine--ammonia ligase [Candidatus Aenigmarchaeota archaeon]MDW8159961.1 diphthine--ammonia ligase [Candidatus Aenigmarchaeota archaeon]
MRVAMIYSGGKDSTLALIKSMSENTVECLINLIPHSEESYVFHFPNTEFVKYQAISMGLPIVQERVGAGEGEMDVFKKTVKFVKDKYKIEGIVSGVIKSSFQYKKFKSLCEEIGIKFITPLWQMDQIEVLKEVIKNKIESIITCVAAYPLDESYLGRRIDESFIEDMKILQKKFGINPSGEGGEYETFVLDAPIFRKRIILKSFEKTYKDYFGVLKFKEVELLEKSENGKE